MSLSAMVLSQVWDASSRCANGQENEVKAVDSAPRAKDSVKIIPASYNSPAEHKGRVEAFQYESNGATKTAYVYLPYGYDPDGDAKYDVLYFMHGGGDNEKYMYDRDFAINDVLDHAIENGEIKPLILVTPTFYNPDGGDKGIQNAGKLTEIFHEEFINDLVPAVESHYRTYAETTDPQGIEASRRHRAFGGFSMGGESTWRQFIHGLDYVAYFMPLSGDCWQFGVRGGFSHAEETAKFLNDVAKSSKYADSFYIYAMTGSRDIAYENMEKQLSAMSKQEAFTFGSSEAEGNISYQVLEGAYHSYEGYRNYIYSILPFFFNSDR